MDGFRVIFGALPDPRDVNASHDLTEVLFIALAAMLCGANDCVAIAEFGRAKEPLLRRFLVLDRGIPSHDTFSRIFRHLDPAALEAALTRFVAALGRALGQSVAGHVVAVDGKRLRGAYDTGRAHMAPLVVSAYLNHTRLVLAQVQAPDCSEVTAVRHLLALIALEGAIVTGDALHCSRKTAAAVRAAKADYVLTLKGNRSTLAAEAAALFTRRAASAPSVETVAEGHGRRERRRACVIAAPGLAARHDFAGLRALGCIESWRTVGDTTSHQVRRFVLSQRLSPADLLSIVREHWAIENREHWVLDVVFDEDHCRARKDHSPANLAAMRRIALNLLRAHPDRASLNIKRQRAGWDDTFLLALFTHMR
jgi:predicted transposase YbfD/YdcC